MRFIRDIIKEKRDADTGGPKPAPAAQAKTDPLVLETPVMSKQDPPVTQKSEAPAQTVQEPASSPSKDDGATAKPVADGTAPADPPTPKPRPQTALYTHTEDLELPEDAEEEDVDEVDADGLPDEDPFEKLRESGQLEAPARQAVSPMRRVASAPKPPSAPVVDKPAPQPAATAPEAPALETPAPEAPVSEAPAPAPMAPAPQAPATPAAKTTAPEAQQTPRADVDALTPAADAMEETVHMPAPAKGRGSVRSGRVKTRLLGFSAGGLERNDPFDKKPSTPVEFPVGWLVVVSDMGRGAAFALHDGVTKVGRGTDQTVSLNFGDNSISRDNHVSIAFDAEQNKFFIGHSGKTNLVRVNNVPLLSTEELKSKDLIRLGETTLRFIAFCAEDFSWVADQEKVAKHA